MAFFDKLGEITKSVGDKTNDMIETNKLNGKIKAEKAAIEAVKAELGALYWAKFEAGAQLDEDAAAMCGKIRTSLENIAGFDFSVLFYALYELLHFHHSHPRCFHFSE